MQQQLHKPLIDLVLISYINHGKRFYTPSLRAGPGAAKQVKGTRFSGSHLARRIPAE